MTEQKGRRTITAEEAKQAREALKAYRAAQADECAARKARREERAHDMALFKALETDSQKTIDECQQALDVNDELLEDGREQLRTLRTNIIAIEKERAAIVSKKSTAYEDRARARERLREYNAEIRTGVRTDYADDTDAADAEERMCSAEHAREMREGR
jgi:hypothetical protein